MKVYLKIALEALKKAGRYLRTKLSATTAALAPQGRALRERSFRAGAWLYAHGTLTVGRAILRLRRLLKTGALLFAASLVAAAIGGAITAAWTWRKLRTASYISVRATKRLLHGVAVSAAFTGPFLYETARSIVTSLASAIATGLADLTKGTLRAFARVGELSGRAVGLTVNSLLRLAAFSLGTLLEGGATICTSLGRSVAFGTADLSGALAGGATTTWRVTAAVATTIATATTATLRFALYELFSAKAAITASLLFAVTQGRTDLTRAALRALTFIALTVARGTATAATTAWALTSKVAAAALYLATIALQSAATTAASLARAVRLGSIDISRAAWGVVTTSAYFADEYAAYFAGEARLAARAVATEAAEFGRALGRLLSDTAKDSARLAASLAVTLLSSLRQSWSTTSWKLVTQTLLIAVTSYSVFHLYISVDMERLLYRTPPAAPVTEVEIEKKVITPPVLKPTVVEPTIEPTVKPSVKKAPAERPAKKQPPKVTKKKVEKKEKKAARLPKIKRAYPYQEISRGPVDKKEISLTFDGGSEATEAKLILNELRKRRIQTTIFVTGQFIKKFPHIMRQMVRDGHEVGNHMWNHPHLTNYGTDYRHRTLPGVTREFVKKQLISTERAYRKVTGLKMAPIWRAPYGEVNKDIRRWAYALGYVHVGWTADYKRRESLDTLDWVDDKTSRLYRTSAEIKERVLNFGKETNGLSGGIILMHLGTNRHEDKAAGILGEMMDDLMAKGYRFVKVSEMMKEG